MDALSSLLGLTLVKGTLLLAVALLLGAALGRAPGLARHRLWSVAFAALLALPAVAALLPPLPLPVPGLSALWAAVEVESLGGDGVVPAASGAPEAPEALSSAAHHPDDRDRTAGSGSPGAIAAASGSGAPGAIAAAPGSGAPGEITATSASGAPDEIAATSGTGGSGLEWWAVLNRSAAGRFLPRGLLLVWLSGFGVGAAVLALGVGRSVLHARRAHPLDDADWLRDLEWHRNFFGIRRNVRLLAGPRVRTPMTGGILRPVVLVPEDAADWTPLRRRLVLLHELVHIRRYDVVRHLLVRLGVALYWFHPLAWLAGRSSAIAREQACDEEVLRLGIKPSAYATHLLALSEQLGAGRIPAAALPMIQRSQLEIRLMKILDSNARPVAAWTPALAATMMVLTAVSVSIAAPAPPARQEADQVARPSTDAGDTATLPVLEPLAAGAGIGAAGVVQESACWPEGMSRIRGRFSGSISTDDRSGRTVVNGVGLYNDDRIVQHWVDDLRLCMRTHGNVDMQDDGRRIGSIGDGARVVLEAELGGRLQSLVIRNDGGGEETTWTVNGEQRPFDASAQRWRDQMTTVLGEHAAIMRLRGQRSSLRGRISSIRGQRSSLRGQISSVRGERSSLRGRISSIRGRRSSLAGEISSARGRVSSLRGQISSARGQVSSLRGQISHHRSALHGLEASRFGANEEELQVIDAAEARHREAIEDLEQQIEDYDVDARVAEIEAQIEAFDLEGRVAQIEARMDDDLEAQVAAVERQIAELDVEGKVAEIEAQIAELDVEGRVAEIEDEIEALNVDERVEEMQERLEPALRELRATIESIG